MWIPFFSRQKTSSFKLATKKEHEPNQKTETQQTQNTSSNNSVEIEYFDGILDSPKTKKLKLASTTQKKKKIFEYWHLNRSEFSNEFRAYSYAGSRWDDKGEIGLHSIRLNIHLDLLTNQEKTQQTQQTEQTHQTRHVNLQIEWDLQSQLNLLKLPHQRLARVQYFKQRADVEYMNQKEQKEFLITIKCRDLPSFYRAGESRVPSEIYSISIQTLNSN